MTRRKNFLLIISILLLTVSSLVFVSCSQAEGAPQVMTLKFIPATGAPENFDEDESYIIRCVSFSENGREITFAPTKSKSFKISTLMFISSTERADSSGNVSVVVVPVSSAESEYDLKQGRTYMIQESAALNLVGEYGITYSDWLVGAASGSDKFPCCE